MVNEAEHVSNINSKIKKAIGNLKNLESVRVTKAFTSNYKYGTEGPSIRDRLDITIQTSGSDQDVLCQVILDSTDYSFPPDLIFKKSSSKLIRKIEDSKELLPGEQWDLNNENCLYDWFSKILEKKEKWYKSDDKQPQNDKVWDIFDDDDIVFQDEEKKPAKKLDLPTEVKDNTKKEHENDTVKSSAKSFPIFNKGKRKIESSDDEELSEYEHKPTLKQARLAKPRATTNRDTREFRRKFILSWIDLYKHHIIQYDSVDFKNLALYMTFNIPEDSPLWTEYEELKSESLKEFKSMTRNRLKVCTKKPIAPMIVNFTLDNSRTLKINLISVMNTIDIKSACPDTTEMEYTIDWSKSMSELTSNIQRYIHEFCIKFHLLQSL